jgi:hypothetical protein
MLYRACICYPCWPVPNFAADRIAANDSQPSIFSTSASAALPTDWDLVFSTQVNVLLLGKSRTTATSIDEMRRHLVEPVVSVRGGDSTDLTSLPSVGTVVLCDLDELMSADQLALNAWLSESNRTRVISTSQVSLVPLIDAGTFSDSLYYRLNTLCLDMTGGSLRGAPVDSRTP